MTGERRLAENVRLAAGAQEVGLAVIMADLIRANLEHDPRKWTDFAKLDLRISLEAIDADVSVTLAFHGGTLVIHKGIQGLPALGIAASAEALIGLAAVRITAGLPFLFGRDGKALRKALRTGRVKIAGALRRPAQLIRFTRLMSVNG